MLEDEIREKIVTTLATEFELDPQKLTPSATLYDDLGLDSLDAVDMVVVLEKEFGVKLSDEEAIRSVSTMDDLHRFIVQLHEKHGVTF